MESRETLTEQIFEAARSVGFEQVGAAPVTELAAAPRFRHWLEARMNGSMKWLEKSPERRADPRAVVAGARSVLVVSRSYFTGHSIAEQPDRARISRYAWGDEYHDVMGAAIKDLYARIRELAPDAVGRYYVDTGPILEKAWAEMAGIGWIGKHTNVIRAGTGSWFFLGAIILDVDLDTGAAAVDHCGSCTACIDACPTAAIVAPYVLDARRCISYLTIENRGPIPVEYREPMGNRVFGCDDCQDVCPWNSFAQPSHNAAPFAPRGNNDTVGLLELFELDIEGFRERFRRSPVKRARFSGLRRNLAIALGNSGDAKVVPALIDALDDEDPLVRGHVAWALGRFDSSAARDALATSYASETDSWARDEIACALAAGGGDESGVAS
jgi:epoxyqueuosine reductase